MIQVNGWWLALALLFISDAFPPKVSVVDRANTDLPAIRIHSDRKWPERVVYDTSFPTIIPAQIANTDASVPAPGNGRRRLGQDTDEGGIRTAATIRRQAAKTIRTKKAGTQAQNYKETRSPVDGLGGAATAICFVW